MVAIVAGLLLGPVDLWGQVAAPYPWAHLFNSPAVWAAAAFAYGRWVRRLPAAAIGAVLVLVIGVEAYNLADVLVRNAGSGNLTSPTARVWIIAGVAAGLVFGVAGRWSVERGEWNAVIGRAALPAILGAEAVHGALRIRNDPADQRPEDLGQFVILLAVLAAISLVALTRGLAFRATILVAGTALVASAVVGTAVSAAI